MILAIITGLMGFVLGFLLQAFLSSKTKKARVQEDIVPEIPEEVKRQEEEEKNAFSTLLSYNIDMVYGGRGLTEEERE
jgi:hypothetical protein